MGIGSCGVPAKLRSDGRAILRAEVWSRGERAWRRHRTPPRVLDLLGRRVAILGTALNFAAALAGLIAAWRWYQTTTIRPPTELPYGGPTTIDTGPLVAFIKEIARLNRRAASWTAFAALLEGLATIAHYYGR